MTDDVSQAREEALSLLREYDSVAVIQFLDRSNDMVHTLRVYAALVNHLYWNEKNLAGVVLMARCGIQHGLTAARVLESIDPLRALELRSISKGLCYDLASFTWIGWDEPGFTIGTLDSAIGLDAARTNLRLAHELQKGNLPLSRGYWMLGAQLMAARLPGAKEAFEEAAAYALAAEAAAEEKLCQAFAQLTRLTVKSEVPSANNALEAIKESLATLENGPPFIQQIETATRIFC